MRSKFYCVSPDRRLLDYRVKWRLPEAEMLFFASLFIWIFTCTLDESLLATYLRMRLIAMLCLCGGFASLIIGNRLPSWSHLGIACAVAALPCLALQGLNIKIWCTVAFVALARGIDLKKLIVCCLASLSLALLVVLVCAVTEAIPNVVEQGSRVRQYLGFKYSLYPSQVVFMITCAIVYLKGGRLTRGHALALVVLNVLFFAWTDSRLSFALSIVVIVGARVLQNRRPRVAARLPGASDIAFCWAFPFAAAVTVAIVALYNPAIEWMHALDSGLGGRLHLGSSALSSYGVLPFGQFIEFVGNGLDSAGLRPKGSYNYVDFLFVNALLRFGVVGVLAFTALMTRASFSAWKVGDKLLLFVLAVIAIHCTIDDLCLYLHFNPFLFAISASLVTADEEGDETLRASLQGLPSSTRSQDWNHLLVNEVG